MYSFTYQVENVIENIFTSLQSYENVDRHKWQAFVKTLTDMKEVVSQIDRGFDNGSPIGEIEELIEPFVDENLYNQIVLDDARETLVKLQNILGEN